MATVTEVATSQHSLVNARGRLCTFAHVEVVGSRCFEVSSSAVLASYWFADAMNSAQVKDEMLLRLDWFVAQLARELK